MLEEMRGINIVNFEEETFLNTIFSLKDEKLF